MSLTDAETKAAHFVVNEWRDDPRQPLPCPRCGATGIEIEDRSARPHTEWYAITCPSCGLDEALAIALGTRPPSLDG